MLLHTNIEGAAQTQKDRAKCKIDIDPGGWQLACMQPFRCNTFFCFHCSFIQLLILFPWTQSVSRRKPCRLGQGNMDGECKGSTSTGSPNIVGLLLGLLLVLKKRKSFSALNAAVTRTVTRDHGDGDAWGSGSHFGALRPAFRCHAALSFQAES